MNAFDVKALGKRRYWSFGLIGIVWFAGIALLIGTIERPVVTVVHWANGHMMDRDTLLPAFARDFNAEERRTASGKTIRIDLVRANSGEIAGEVISRVSRGIRVDRKKPDPSLVTPAADHWLNDVNHALGTSLLDMAHASTLATTYVGIVTTREMAECLGWPKSEIGWTDIVLLATDNAGWDRYPCARAEWGKEALVAFTYPSRSSTARSVLYALHAVVAGKAPSGLTLSDTANPELIGYVRKFQSSVDCYVPDTLDLNTKIVAGPGCAHFFLIAEDNLVKLYQGKVKVLLGDTTIERALERDLVMIYPKEGSLVHNHSAFLVPGPWMNEDEREAALQWAAYLREPAQQYAFLQEGFRSTSDVGCVDPMGSPFSPCAFRPQNEIYPDSISPEVAAAILQAWR